MLIATTTCAQSYRTDPALLARHKSLNHINHTEVWGSGRCWQSAECCGPGTGFAAATFTTQREAQAHADYLARLLRVDSLGPTFSV